MQQEPNKSISLRDITWDEVDYYSRKIGFKDRSPFVEYCIDKEMHPKKRNSLKNIEIITLLFLAILTLMICLIFIRGV